jgi:Holliday junction resolvase
MPDSRRKGRDAERELEKIIEKRGIEVDRYQGGREQPRGDLGFLGVRCDSKRREAIRIIAWSREQEEKVADHLIPAVAYRTNGEPWRVSVPLDDFLDLCEQAAS